MNALDALFTISCGNCGVVSPVDEWQRTEVSGALPPNEFQCPCCGFALRRQPKRDRKEWEKFIELKRIAPRL